ncbi:MAG: imidazole glycerol phosphate synthase subunit HisH, partial [Lactococcus raffinolactis]
LTADQAVIQSAAGLILPGVGAFPTAMAELEKRDLVATIKAAVAMGTPLLGICLGMQLLLDASEEHVLTAGLGLIPGICRAIPASDNLKVPHMGWNQLDVVKPTALTANLQDSAVYFVHSYFTDVAPDYLDVTADYGIKVPAMISHDHVYGAQFHPEKSGDVGLGILEKFKEVVYADSASN